MSERRPLELFSEIGPALKHLRLQRGLTKRTQLARLMGVEEPYRYAKNRITKYENGTVLPPLGELDHILTTLGADLSTLAAALRAAQGDETEAATEFAGPMPEPEAEIPHDLRLRALERRVEALEAAIHENP